MTKTLSGFKSYGIREPLTNRIAGILDEYPDGTQIARELLQNSDDACSKVQWYLLDHRHHCRYKNTNKNTKTGTPSSSSDTLTESTGLKLFHEDFIEYMGPALLAGNDSLFEEKDFISMRNLAASEKRSDETKIGQMGIGFNSIYHMTDCPSFISGDQFMVIEPHERILNSERSAFSECAVRGSFVKGGEGLDQFPDQLRTFSVLEDIDFSKPFPGTIFRFPLRTEKQAEISLLSKNAYRADKVLEMLMKLKEEALKGILFLKHIERIAIYERKENEETPAKLFEIEIINAEEVQKERLLLLANLKDHVHPEPSASTDAILEYSVRPVFRLTQGDGCVTQESWHITTMVGNFLKAQEYMTEQTDGNLSSHKLIPWVGIAAPSEPGIMIDSSRLFCFLPIGIQLPFPVHINGHFAVKHSRREIWTNQDNDFARHASAYIKSMWNIHLFQTHVPAVYAKFLTNLGLARGAGYDLWPTSCGEGLGLDSIWKDLLKNLLQVVFNEDLGVFFCGSEKRENLRLVGYSSSWIAGRDIDAYPELLEALKGFTDVVADLPDAVLEILPNVAESLNLENRILTPASVRKLLRDHKYQWSSGVSKGTKIQMLKYCIRDGDILDLNGLPLLPLAGDLWVEFDDEKAMSRYLVTPEIFKTLSYSNEGLVDNDVDAGTVKHFNTNRGFDAFWSSLSSSELATRIQDFYRKLCYKDKTKTKDTILQTDDAFPTTEWLSNFWDMVNSQEDHQKILSLLEGFHIVPITRQRLAPLVSDVPVAYLQRSRLDSEPTLVSVFAVLEEQLDCRVLREGTKINDDVARDYVFEISEASKVLGIVSRISSERIHALSQENSHALCEFMALWLPCDSSLNSDQLRALRTLPIYRSYEKSTLTSLEEAHSKNVIWQAAHRFSHSDYPWLPVAFRLLADGQPMLRHLNGLLKVRTIKEAEYWLAILSNLSRYPDNDWDSIMEKFCAMYHVHSKDHDFKDLLSNLAFVRAEGPSIFSFQAASRLQPQNIVNPSLSEFFLDDEQVFPSGVYAKPSVLNVLTELGARYVFDASFVTERIRTLSSRAQSGGTKSSKTVLLDFYAHLNANASVSLLSSEAQEALRSRPWILAKTLSEQEYQVYTPSDCRPETDLPLVGSEMPVSTFQFTNGTLLECMRWNLPPPLNKVLNHFQRLIERSSASISSGDTRPDETEFIAIYKYLKGQTHNLEALKIMKDVLGSKPWILINGSLHTVDRVALKMSLDLAPHFVQIKTPGLDELFLAMGAREEVGQEDLQLVMSSIGSRYGEDEELSNDDAEFVLRLLQVIVGGATFRASQDIEVLTQNNRMCKIRGVVYNDVNATLDMLNDLNADRNEDTSEYTFASYKISRSLAYDLQIPMFSTQFWDIQRDPSFVLWAQEENIVDRIKSILTDYDPSSIFSEFLQNAADAGATKCSFMLDLQHYGKTKVLNKDMAIWQGPALVIYNDAEFKEDDFIALSKLGVGNKREDSSKIGRHGLGFNAAYHFTDVPSVVSGSYIGFFDPQKAYLPKSRTARGLVGQGGQRCNFLKLKGNTLSDQLAPYKGLFGCDMQSHFHGTIFRIPLRTLEMQSTGSRSMKMGDQWTLPKVQSMLRTWVEDAKVGLLFLENMETIELMVRGALIPEDNLSWSATKKLGSGTPSFDAALSQGNSPSTLTRIAEISSDRKPKSDSSFKSGSKSKEIQTWLLHTDVDFPADTSDQVKNLAKEYGWNAHRGIAIPLDFKFMSANFAGRLFAHLPTPIATGLRFHLHGVFALTSNRKTLARGSDKESPQAIWNESVLRDLLPLTATCAFEKLLIWHFQGRLNRAPKAHLGNSMNAYLQYWPYELKEAGSLFVKSFSRLSYSRPIFPCLTPKGLPVRFCKGEDVIFPGLDGANTNMVQIIHACLLDRSYNICECPSFTQTQLQKDWKTLPALPFNTIDEDCVRRLIRDDPKFIPRQVRATEDQRWILEYILKTILDRKKPVVKEPVIGLSLLPLMNGDWVPLGCAPMHYTANANARDLINGGDALVNEGLFVTPVSGAMTGETVVTKPLDSIFKKLATDPIYGIAQLPPAKFVSIFLAENPNGVPEDKRDRLWGLLSNSTDLDAYGELPILKTLSNVMVPLRHCRDGMEISKLEYTLRMKVEKLGSLIQALGHIVFDAAQNRKHAYLTEASPKIDVNRILKVISRACNNWPEGREITKEEAEVLRNMIMEADDDRREDAPGLGNLRIWISWGKSGAPVGPLIKARGSFFLEGKFKLDHLGNNADVIQSEHCKWFQAMGAKPLNVISAAEDRVIPKLLDGTLRCSNINTRHAYINMLSEIIKLASKNNGKGPAAKIFLSFQRFLLARDGAFYAGRDLLDPSDNLLSVVLVDEHSRFPDANMWSYIGPSRKAVFGIRDSSDASVVRECAQHLLHLTTGFYPLQEATIRSRATTMVQFLYQHCQGTNWMEPQWRIVPAEVIQSSPQSAFAPKLPSYLSFSELVDPSHRDICWTQCAFFPEALKPSAVFRNRFPTVGNPPLKSIVCHLSALAKDLASSWTSTEQQLTLKMSLFKVYTTLDDFAKESSSNRDILKTLLLKELQVPYILNGDDKDPSVPESWLWPDQLILDVDNNQGHQQVVHPKLLSMRQFLVAVGVDQFEKVEGQVEVPEGRQVGEIENRLFNCFESQDRHNGFMDVRFNFADGKQIMAHKFMLVHANEYFKTRFTGGWSEHTTRDPMEPGVEVINLSKQHEYGYGYDAFWGLLHYFYTDNLITSNGPPVPPEGWATVTKSEDDGLGDRVQYLMELLQLADEYRTPRLKALIAFQVVTCKKVVPGNVFNIREYAKLYGATEIKGYCEEFILKNASVVRKYLNSELKVYRKSLSELTGAGDRAERAEEIKELEMHLKELSTLV